MKLSHRITHLTPSGSDGWEVFYRARQMIEAGIEVIELTIGEHDIGTDPVILDAMHRAAKGGHTGYAMVPGIQSLREIVACRIEERTGVTTTYENILITPGGQAALFAAHLAACNEGDTALFIDPYYATYPGTIRSIGAQPVAIPTQAESAFLPSPEDLAPHAAKASSLLINTPNNPTGMVYPRQTLEGIAEICRKHDLWLISDEVYDSQVWDGEHLSPRALPGMAERTLVVGSMSKSHAMTGSRVGWICGPHDAIAHLINLATHTTYGVPGYIQDAAEFAIQQGPDLEAKIAEPFRRRRALARNILTHHNRVGLIPSQGAMYLMLDIRATGLSGLDFANRLLDTHQIAVMPGESFGRAAAGHVRVALTVDDARLVKALETLCRFATELSKVQSMT